MGAAAILRQPRCARRTSQPRGICGRLSDMHQLTSVDAQFLAAEDGRVHGHVTGLALYDGRLTVNDVVTMIQDRIHLLTPFRQRLVRVPLGIDLPYWGEDPDFNAADHVHAHTLP